MSSSVAVVARAGGQRAHAAVDHADRDRVAVPRRGGQRPRVVAAGPAGLVRRGDHPRPAGVQLDTAVAAADAATAPGVDGDVAEMDRVAGHPADQPVAQHGAATDAGRHDHADDRIQVPARAEPVLTEGEAVAVAGQPDQRFGAGQLLDHRPGAGHDREAAPGADVDRRHRTGRLVDRSGRADPDRRRGPARLQQFRHGGRQRAEHLVGVGRPRRRLLGLPADPALVVDQRRGDLGPADVDRQHLLGHPSSSPSAQSLVFGARSGPPCRRIGPPDPGGRPESVE